MTQYILRRLFTMVPLFFGITIVSFLVINLAPGSPISIQTDLNPKMTAEARERLRTFYGLDKPLHLQYYNWLKHLVTFDLGRSFSTDNRLVIDKIKERLPITIFINVLALLLILVIALPLGVLSAVYQNSLFDRTTTVFVFIGFAIPTFWLALLLMILFGIHLGWLPISGLKSINYEYLSFVNQIKDRAAHLILPVLLAAFGGLAGLSRYSRSNMLEVIRQDYITTARAKGLSEFRVIYKHALRNALLPVVTILGLSVPGLIGGSVIFETIFAIPGMGQLFFGSVMMRDYTVIMGILVIGALLTMIGNLLADISYALVDPRIRMSK
jgi:peptide/nickel transport system permease protein